MWSWTPISHMRRTTAHIHPQRCLYEQLTKATGYCFPDMASNMSADLQATFSDMPLQNPSRKRLSSRSQKSLTHHRIPLDWTRNDDQHTMALRYQSKSANRKNRNNTRIWCRPRARLCIESWRIECCTSISHWYATTVWGSFFTLRG